MEWRDGRRGGRRQAGAWAEVHKDDGGAALSRAKEPDMISR